MPRTRRGPSNSVTTELKKSYNVKLKKIEANDKKGYNLIGDGVFKVNIDFLQTIENEFSL